MSLDSGEDSKADDMDEMTMPNPGSIQVSLAWTFILIVTMLKMKHCLYHWWWILSRERLNSWKEEWVDGWKRDIQKAMADVNIRLENIQKTDSNKEITQNKTLTKPSQVLTSTQQHKIRGKHISQKRSETIFKCGIVLNSPTCFAAKKTFLALFSPFSTNIGPFLALFVHD